MKGKWKAKLLSSKLLLDTPIFKVTDNQALDPEGHQIRRLIVTHAGSAVTMPVNDENRVLLVRQYRLPAEQYLWELPAGRIDPGESPLQAAKRELVEETGYRARRWTKLAQFYSSPGFLAEHMTIYLATGLIQGEPQPVEDERIELHWFSSPQMEKAIRNGGIIDGKTIIGYLTWKNQQARGAGA